MQDVLITVIVPVYQMEAYLAECIDSILAQTHSNFQLLLINDGSTDKSPEICDGYAQKDERVEVVHQENRGLSGARNSGLELAKGEYIAHIDADDYVNCHYLELLLGLCQRQQVKIACCNHLIFREDGKVRERFPSAGNEQILSQKDAIEGVLYHRIPDVSTWGKLIHRSVYSGLRYPQGRVYEDSARIAETLLSVDRIGFLPQPLYHYRIRKDSISRAVFHESKMDFLWAVEHMTKLIEEKYPEMRAGCLRRKVHAALSIRRYFVDCGDELIHRREELEKMVLRNGKAVLRDNQAPMRDKIAILSLYAGPKVYDFLWKVLQKF